MIHDIAKIGFASGTNDHYDKARPSYPEEALSALYSSIPKTEGPLKIAELGSGTGLFTRALLNHPTFGQAVGELRAIEPSEGMRETFNKRTSDSRVSCLPGDFLKTGVEDGWADLVVIAQAFHWCPDYDKAAAEFARILKPKGIVAFIWNLEDRERSSWVAKIRDLIEPYEQGSPQFRLGLWKAVFDTPSYKANFQPPETKIWDYVVPTTSQGVHDRAFSKSYIAVLQTPEADKVHQEIDRILETSEKDWIDEKEGVFKYNYETFLVIMRHVQVNSHAVDATRPEATLFDLAQHLRPNNLNLQCPRQQSQRNQHLSSQPKPEAKGSDASKRGPAPAVTDGAKPSKPKNSRPRRRPNKPKGTATPAQKKDDGESEPEGRAVRRTAGTPSGSEDESEEEEVKSPKSPNPPRSPTAAKSPKSPKQPAAAKSSKPPQPAKAPEVKPAEAKLEENKPAQAKPTEENFPESKPAEEAKLEAPGAGDENPNDAGPDEEKKGRKGHGPGYVNKDRHKTGGERGKMTAEELAQKMEQMRIRNEEIKRKRQEADADAEEFERSMAANREAEKAQREAAAARRKEQLKVQASIDDERKKNAERKMQKLQGREWDAQKEEADWNHDRPLRGRGGFEGRGRGGRGGRGGGRGGRGGRGGGFNDGRPGRQGAPSPEATTPADPNDKTQFPDLPSVAAKE
ncbi:WD40 repeat-like protein, partial [Rhizoctonia solani]